MHELTHASFFSGVGGLDLGLERAGWRTVSFSEIDPYASAVLAERWPGVPNLGCIHVANGAPAHQHKGYECIGLDRPETRDEEGNGYGSRDTGNGVLPGHSDEHADGGATRGAATESARVEGQGGGIAAGVVGPRVVVENFSRREQPGDGAATGAGAVREPAWGTATDGHDAPDHGGRREAGTGLSSGVDWRNATLWTGGFPCQDLSVAGKRRGMGTEEERTRSGLAYAFLDLVRQHRPPAILLENVPGLLSSNAGRDFGALLASLGELGYWWAYRILDAQFFGVPQRRRRVFICAVHAGAGFGADSAAAVLSVGSRCDGHLATSDEARTPATDRFANGIGSPGGEHAGHLADGRGQEATLFNATAKFGEFVEDDIAGNLSARDYKSSNHLIRPSPDPGGVREADGMAGRLDDLPRVADTLNSGGNDGGFRTEPGAHLVAYWKAARVNADPDSPESWVDDGLANTLNNFDVGDVRTTHAVVGGTGGQPGESAAELLPLGLDSHRYRCCGNGVVSNVSEWIGVRLAAAVQ